MNPREKDEREKDIQAARRYGHGHIDAIAAFADGAAYGRKEERIAIARRLRLRFDLRLAKHADLWNFVLGLEADE